VRLRRNGCTMGAMHCAEREKLIQLLTNAALAYSEAVRSLSGAEGDAIPHTREWADRTHSLCEECHELLAEHERAHGCTAKGATVSGS
jgi:hypothetical protein